MSDGQDIVIEFVMHSMYLNDVNLNQPSHVTHDLIALYCTVIDDKTWGHIFAMVQD